MANDINEIIERLREAIHGSPFKKTVGWINTLCDAYEEQAKSNDLYRAAAERARALWKESHGGDPKWSPGADHLMVWMGDQLAAKDEEIADLTKERDEARDFACNCMADEESIEMAVMHHLNNGEATDPWTFVQVVKNAGAEIERLKHPPCTCPRCLGVSDVYADEPDEELVIPCIPTASYEFTMLSPERMAEIGASLTAADALRGQLIKLGEKMGKCPFCGEAAGAWPLHIYETCPLVAFDTAHTFKENDHASSS